MVDKVKSSFWSSQTLGHKILRVSLKGTVLLAVLFLIYYLKHLYLNEKLTFHITPDVIAIDDILTTAYLIKGDEGYLLIDTGFDRRVISKALMINKIRLKEIKILLITHSDFDHHYLSGLFPEAKIYISRKEFDMVKSKTQRFFFIPFLHNYLPAGQLNLLEEGSIIQFGDKKINCVLLPGHTAGSMGYIVDQKYFFTGDAFRLNNGRVVLPFKKQIVMNTDMMIQSIRKIKSFKSIQYIFTANSGYTADFNFALAEW